MKKKSKRRAVNICAGVFTALMALGCSVAYARATLYVGMNGGDLERTYVQHVFPPFEKIRNVKIIVEPGTSVRVLAKAQAQRDKPQMHVMLLDDGIMDEATSAGLCAPLAPSPELFALYLTARTKGDMAAAINMGVTGLAYNTKVFAENGWAPPTSWMDLADPKYKGKVVVQSIVNSSYGLHAFLMINRVLGGTDDNLAPAFDKWPVTVGPNVPRYVNDSVTIGDMLGNGEVDLLPISYAGAIRLKQSGLPVDYTAPKEGVVILSTHECVIANNDQPELAQQLAQYLLSPQAQRLAREFGGVEPSSRNVKGSAQFLDSLRQATVVNWPAINQQRAQWSKQWERLVANQ